MRHSGVKFLASLISPILIFFQLYNLELYIFYKVPKCYTSTSIICKANTERQEDKIIIKQMLNSQRNLFQNFEEKPRKSRFPKNVSDGQTDGQQKLNKIVYHKRKTKESIRYIKGRRGGGRGGICNFLELSMEKAIYNHKTQRF